MSAFRFLAVTYLKGKIQDVFYKKISVIHEIIFEILFDELRRGNAFLTW